MDQDTYQFMGGTPRFEALEPRLLLDGQVGLLGLQGPEPMQSPYVFEFSVDIGSDAELSDPNVTGNEGFDPGDVYLWQSTPVTPPPVPGGRDGFKDDARIFGVAAPYDPPPDPPDLAIPPATAVPVGEGSPADYPHFFDMDGHDQIDVPLQEFLPPQGTPSEPIPQFPSQCIFPARPLMVSFEDDMAPGWPAGDVPVTRPSPAGNRYGTSAGQDEIQGVDLSPGPPPYAVASTYTVADENTVHTSLAPNPDLGEDTDDDVDSLDIVTDQGACQYWLFSADHEANFQLDPGDIYQTSPGGGFVQVIDDVVHLGLPDSTDVDAFELVWVTDQAGASVLGILFSVDDDDPLTAQDESGGLDPGMIYLSYLTGNFMPALREGLGDDIDALTNWTESLGPGRDWGDAPDSATAAGYPTLAINSGANHIIGGPWLGDDTDVPDPEPDGQPDPNAMGDDLDTTKPVPNDDEDGVLIPVLVQGQSADITIQVNSDVAGGGGVVEAWIDFNGDKVWQHPGEQVFAGWLANGTHTITINVPSSAVLGQTFARFRISSNGGLSPLGPASDGEVEDHEVIIEAPPPELDFGDAPDPSYATLLVNDGARHVIQPRVYLGSGIDDESDGQPDAQALGDDNDAQGDDEDGVVFPGQLVAGKPATVQVTASVDGMLNAWLDFNADGDWDDPGEQIFTDTAVVAGLNTLTFLVPADATPWVMTFARFRFNTAGGLGYTGLAQDGEVEDYRVWVVEVEQYDKWYQPPAPASPDNVYYGWNEWSTHGGFQIAADDWVCTTDEPVTDIVWWGSFYGWNIPDEPPLPEYFHLAMWTDVPAGPNDPFSHPGQVIWELDCRNFTWEWVGWDYDPRSGTYEACYRFEQRLNREEWFIQEPDQNGIYWLSIAAGYPEGMTDFPFGWKTLPRRADSPAPDDAVRIFDPTGAHVGDAFTEGEPIWWPTEAESWDLAFELKSRSSQEVLKWEQKPDLSDLGLDVNASSGELQPYVLADDFECTSSEPLTRVTLWTSWYHDYCPWTEVPEAVDIILSIHADIPADQSPTGYSMPGDLLWEHTFQPGDFTVTLVADNIREGWLNPPDVYEPVGDTMCWRYDLYIDPADAFVQQGSPDDPVVYWLDVTAVPHDPQAILGWKSSTDHWNDDAVWGIAMQPAGGEEPASGIIFWNELRYPDGHPQAGESIDLAFAIYGLQTETTTKWSQPPEPYMPPDAFHGWDELSVYGSKQVVADDWLCTTDEPVTDIHWWGSFLGWSEPEPPWLPDAFHIAIWTDVPASPEQPFSHPGDVIWEVWCRDYTVEPAGWDFDPRDPFAAPEATFYFTQDLRPEEWFWQRPGDNVYWISIAAVYGEVMPEFPFGWKTRPRESASPAPDDAVRIFHPTRPVVGTSYIEGGPIYWPTENESWDMAFALTTQDLFDYGDAPDAIPGAPPAGTYPTRLVNDGARHRIQPGLHLGRPATIRISQESSPGAGDFDANVLGYVNPYTTTLTAAGYYQYGTPYGASFNGPAPALTSNLSHLFLADTADGLCLFVVHDKPQDGTGGSSTMYWVLTGDTANVLQDDDPGEGVTVGGGGTTFTTSHGWAACCTDGFALGSLDGAWSMVGEFTIPVANTGMNGWTVFSSDGATIPLAFETGRRVRLDVSSHNPIDPELDGQPTVVADGDDALDGNDDEDGVVFTSALVPGRTASVEVIASAAGLLDAWVDFDADGTWTQPTDQVFASQPLVAGVNSLTFTVPGTAVTGTTFARFRFSSVGGLSYVGPAPDGEVEDYAVKIVPGASISGTKFHDLNGNRARDPGEPGRAGWTIFLDHDNDGTLDPGEPWTTSGTNGQYSFTNLAPGVYFVAEVPVAHWAQSYPVSPPQVVVLQPGQAVTGVDLGNVIVGDANGDCKVGIADLGALADNYGGPGNWQQGDFNWDGFVGIADLGALADNYGYSYPGCTGSAAGGQAVSPGAAADDGGELAALLAEDETIAESPAAPTGTGTAVLPVELVVTVPASTQADGDGLTLEPAVTSSALTAVLPADAGGNLDVEHLDNLLAGPNLSVLN